MAEQPDPGDTAAGHEVDPSDFQQRPDPELDALDAAMAAAREHDLTYISPSSVSTLLAAASPYIAGVAAARERDAVLDQVRQFRDRHNPKLNHVCCVSDLLFALLGGDGDKP